MRGNGVQVGDLGGLIDFRWFGGGYSEGVRGLSREFGAGEWCFVFPVLFFLSSKEKALAVAGAQEGAQGGDQKVEHGEISTVAGSHEQ
jgi:hypothetical protein